MRERLQPSRSNPSLGVRPGPRPALFLSMPLPWSTDPKIPKATLIIRWRRGRRPIQGWLAGWMVNKVQLRFVIGKPASLLDAWSRNPDSISFSIFVFLIYTPLVRGDSRWTARSISSIILDQMHFWHCTRKIYQITTPVSKQI